MAITDIIGGSIGEAAAKIISLFKVDPNKALEHEKEMAEIQASAAKAIQDSVTAEIEAASANIRADAASGDRYTQRARPTFMYLVCFILGWNYVFAPLFNRQVLNLPDPLFWLFGSAILGYTGARAWEKVMALPGESQVSFLGMKSSNKQ